MSTHWLYIGCNLSELPPNFLEDSKKLTKDEIRGILETIPIVDGSITAASQDQLIKILISNGIYPIKIKPHSNVDDRIIRLRNIRNKASKSINPDKYIEEVRVLNQFPLPEPKKSSWKLKLFIFIVVVIAAVMLINKYKLPLLEN